jgi:hypothetical protein
MDAVSEVREPARIRAGPAADIEHGEGRRAEMACDDLLRAQHLELTRAGAQPTRFESRDHSEPRSPRESGAIGPRDS